MNSPPSASRSLFLGLLLLLVSSVTASETANAANPFLSSGNGGNSTYLSWIAEYGAAYDRSTFLPSSSSSSSSSSSPSPAAAAAAAPRHADGGGDGVAVHWSIDSKSETIRLAVAATANGWVGFGIAEVGGMPGSDVFVFTASDSSLVDGHVGMGSVAPTVDSCQDWELLRSVAGGGFIIVEAKRPLDTGDPQDRPIVDDSNTNVPPHRIIAAWGDGDVASYHGNDRVRGAVRFRGLSDGRSDGDAVISDMRERSDGYLDLTADGSHLPNDRTRYIQPCFSRRRLRRLGLPEDGTAHVIGFEPIIDNAGSNLHHLGLVSYGGDHCEGSIGVSVYIWAPGEGPLELPSDVGASIGEGSTMSYALQVHYNPTGKSGLVDSSGVRLYYTTKPRMHELGFLEIGDPLTALHGAVVGEGLSGYTFDCPSACSEGFDVESITVVREMLHMHRKGVRMVNRQMRDGEVIRQAAVEHYDYRYAGIVSAMQGSYVVRRGDAFRTTCYYDSDAGTTFGFETENEMCIAFLLYYPKQEIDRCGLHTRIESCSGDYEVKALSSVSELDRLFGVEPEECGISKNG